ncbi:hypothetical protein PVK06_027142 [Gossypium arboreum]|uniref:DUF4283 domain-containing protein n=1 Tax=Gossypium arboreum TaxID=29729 RepID=A0ABR0NZU5_GOSAR|nr:hypothetical protein PVK06_027142 [Gossypium arboreum]
MVSLLVCGFCGAGALVFGGTWWDMENDLDALRIMEDEEDVIQLSGLLTGRTSLYEFCFVGCFVTASVIHFPDMHNTLANLWHPLGGIQITDLREKQFLFWFFYRVDFDRVVRGAHWTFNNHLLVFHCLCPSKDPFGAFDLHLLLGAGS